jgi:hypothetical protein
MTTQKPNLSKLDFKALKFGPIQILRGKQYRRELALKIKASF